MIWFIGLPYYNYTMIPSFLNHHHATGHQYILTYSRYVHRRRKPEVDELWRLSLMRGAADAVPSGVVSADHRSESGVGALKSRLRGGAGDAGRPRQRERRAGKI